MHTSMRRMMLGSSLLMLTCATCGCARDELQPERDYEASPAAQPAGSDLPDLEQTSEPGDAVADPFTAWAAARDLVSPGGTVRRIAFARHGLFLFHARAGSVVVENNFLRWDDNAYRVELRDEMDPELFKGPGVDPERVEPSLRRLQTSPVWQRHAAQLDSFFLEEVREQMVWVLMPVPTAGYREGVPIPTYEVAFE